MTPLKDATEIYDVMIWMWVLNYKDCIEYEEMLETHQDVTDEEIEEYRELKNSNINVFIESLKEKSQAEIGGINKLFILKEFDEIQEYLEERGVIVEELDVKDIRRRIDLLEEDDELEL